MSNVYVPKMYKITEVETLSHDTRMFRIDGDFSYQPGQFYEVTVPYVGEAPISVSSYSDKYLELTVRAVGNVTKAMHKLKKGDSVGLRGPYGNGYSMNLLNGNTIIIIGGGCGVAPVRGAIQYVEANPKVFLGLEMYFGFRNYNEILYKKDLKQWVKEGNVKISLDKSDGKKIPHLDCDVGVVTKLIEKEQPNNQNKIVLICGPPVMIKFVIQTLEKFGFHHDQIFVSMERLMQCGTMKCGHCLVGGKYVCRDGPVFRYDQAKWLAD